MTPKNTTSNEYATESEVEAEICKLSKADLLRLARFGGRYAAGLRAHGVGMDGDDLLQTAITRTWSGERMWRKRVKFMNHLISTMSSIASHEKDKHRVIDASGDASAGNEEPAEASAFPARSMGPEVEAAAHERINQIDAQFADDDEAALVIQAHADGLKGPEVQADLGITPREYETIMTRIRRGIGRELGWRP